MGSLPSLNTQPFFFFILCSLSLSCTCANIHLHTLSLSLFCYGHSLTHTPLNSKCTHNSPLVLFSFTTHAPTYIYIQNIFHAHTHTHTHTHTPNPACVPVCVPKNTLTFRICRHRDQHPSRLSRSSPFSPVSLSMYPLSLCRSHPSPLSPSLSLTLPLPLHLFYTTHALSVLNVY